MKFRYFIVALFVASGASADLVVSPLSQLTMWPSSASSETKGKDKYCVFRDSSVVQVLQSRCPAGVAPAKTTPSTAGKTDWCVITR
jgi:hypothetical protein